MANIKEVVNLLCRMVEDMGCSEFQPESFRLAKFNDLSVVSNFWRLMYEFLFFYKSRTPPESLQHLSAENIIFVKRELYMMGYQNDSFVALPTEVSSENGSSRELLLALGWFLSSSDFFKRYAQSCADVDAIYVSKFTRELGKNRNRLSLPRMHSSTCIDETIVNAVSVNGKLQVLLKSLSRLMKDYTKLLERLECSSSSPDVLNNPASITIALSSDSQLLEDTVNQLEISKVRLTHLVHWKRLEHVFWGWLESVIEEKSKSKESVDEKALQEGYSHILADRYGDMTTFLLQASRSEKILRDRLLQVDHKDIDDLVDSVSCDLEDYLSFSGKFREISPSRRSVRPETIRSARVHTEQQSKAAEVALKKICDRYQLEINVDRNEFSKTLKELAETNLD